MGSRNPQPRSCDAPLGMAELEKVKDEPRRPLPSSAKNEQQDRLCGQASENADVGGGEQPQGCLGDKLFPCLRVKAAASPLFGERRVESQEPTASTPKFTWKRVKPA